MKTLRDRIEEKVSIVPITGCWMWMGSLSEKGYAKMLVLGKSSRQFVHRLAYEEFTGKKIDKPETDHKCRNRWCVNPEHIEPVTHSENQKRSPLKQRGVKRFARCRKGHEFTDENTYYMQNGDRTCGVCLRARQRERYHRLKLVKDGV